MNLFARSTSILLLAGSALVLHGALALGCGPAQDVRAPGPEDGPQGGGPGGPGGPGRKPPQEAIAACDGRASGDACSFKLGDGEIQGLCDAPPNDSALSCRPNGPPPGGHGGHGGPGGPPPGGPGGPGGPPPGGPGSPPPGGPGPAQ